MAKKIRGMTIDIGADTSKFEKAMNDSYDKIGRVSKEVRNLKKLLKEDPGNVNLFGQTFTAMNEQLDESKKKLKALKAALSSALDEVSKGNGSKEIVRALNEEIFATERAIRNLEKDIRSVERSFTAFEKLKRSISSIDGALRKNEQGLKALNNALKLDPKNLDLVKQKQELLADSIDKTRQKLELVKKAQKEASSEFAKGNIGKDEYAKISAQVVQTTDDLKKLMVEADVVGQKFKDLSGKFEAFGSRASKIGSNLTKKISAPIIGGLGLATKAATEFEQAMAGVRKTTDMSQVELAEMGQEFRNIAKESPVAAKEIAGIGEMAGQLGVDKEHIVDFSKTISDLTIATNLTAEQGAMDLARFMNITGATFDETSRLGSAIVELGNNYATTETEILEMSTRLAAQATIAGFSSAETMGLATALSSVGLKAEAGGTSFSSLLQKINTFALGSNEQIARVNEMLQSTGYTMEDVSQAIENGTSASGASLGEMANAIGMTEDELRALVIGAEEGSDKLNTFASVAGMSAKEFAEKWKKDPVEALEAFLKGVDDVIKGGGDLSGVFKDLGINGRREIDTVQRLASKHELLGNAVEDASKAYESDMALKKEVDIFNQTFGNRLKILKNNVIDLGISFGEKLIPHLESFVERLKNIVAKLDNMKPETMERLLKALLGLAAIGPGISLVGKLAGGLGKVFEWGSKVSENLTLLKGGLDAANTGAGLFAKALTAIHSPAGLVFGLITTVGIPALIALVNYMKGASVESDIFGNDVSEGTQKAIQGYLDLDREAGAALNNLKATGETVSKDTAENIVGNFATMGEDLVTELEDQRDRVQETLGSIWDVNDPENGKENAEKINKVEEFYNEQIKDVQEGEKRIQEILNSASREKRKLTGEEFQEISGIQSQMKESAINNLTESEEETAIIRRRMKDNAGAITTEMMSEMITQSANKRDQVIGDAEDEYDEQIRIAENLRAEGGTINNEMADEIIKAAKRKKDETIRAAEKEHEKVVKEAEQQGKDIIDNIDTVTGEIKPKWQTFWEGMSKGWTDFWGGIGDWMREKIPGLGKWVDDFWKRHDEKMSKYAGESLENLNTVAGQGMDEINRTTEEKMNTVFGTSSKAWHDMQVNASDEVGTMNRNLSDGIDFMNETANIKFGEVNSTVNTAWDTANLNTSGRLDFLNRTVGIKFDGMNTDTSEKLDTVNETVGGKFGEMDSIVQNRLSTVNTTASGKFDGMNIDADSRLKLLNATAGKSFDTVDTDAESKLGSASKTGIDKFTKLTNQATLRLNELTNNANNSFNKLNSNAIKSFTNIGKGVTNSINNMVRNVTNSLNNMVNTFNNSFNRLSTNTKSKFENIKKTIINAIKSAASNAKAQINNMVNNSNSGFQAMANNGRNQFNYLKNNMVNTMRSAVNTISGEMNRLKSIFNTTLPSPRVVLPHPRISGSFSLDPPRVPSVWVEWYKKGAIFTKPTMFNTPYGIKGVGEAGPEAVLPIEKLADIFADTMKKVNDNGTSDTGIVITGNTFNVRNEDDIEKVARQLYRYIETKRRGVGLG